MIESNRIEHLGSGMGRILPVYGRESFLITENFMRLIFYKAIQKASDQATEQAILDFCSEPRTTSEIMEHLDLKHREHFRSSILKPLLENGKLELTIPDKPTSPKQKYKTNQEHN